MGWHVSPQSAYADHHGGIWRMSTDHPSRSHMTGVKGQGGFSLIDVAVVMAIVGILLAGFLATYKMYQATRATTITEENFMASQEALGAFIPFKGNRYPRPAPFGLSDGEAGYGEEVEVADIHGSACTNTTAKGKVCRGTGVGGKTVLIGALPFADLNMSDTQARDGYGRMFTYAVTEELTQPNGIDPLDVNADNVPDRDADGDVMYKHYVCVKTQDINDNGTVTLADCTKANDNPPRPIALISHGSDGVGGWLPSGTLYSPCGAVAAASQNDNCNFDGTFIQATRRTSDDNGTPGDTSDDFLRRQPIIVQGDNANKNDDKIQVEVREDGNYWGMAGAAGSEKIGNKYNYKVGIGVLNPPTNPLEVGGNVLAEQGVLSNELCADGTNCLKTEALAGQDPDMNCGQLGMVRDIKNNQVTCVHLAQPNTSCTSTQYIVGFNVNGTPVCRDLPATCGSAHGEYRTVAPAVGERCANGTQNSFAGTNPWTWSCTLGSQTVNCATAAAVAPPEPPSCIDECGETRFDGNQWCRRGGIQGKRRCSGTSVVDEGCISGLGCCAGGNLMCP